MRHALELYGQWFRRELSQRYAGAALGPLWLLLQPLSFIAVITLVFHGFFRTRWPTGDGSALDYALQVFVGLSLHNCAAEVLSRAPTAVVSHPYLVTKVRFPLMLLPAVTVGLALMQLLLSLVLVAAAAAIWAPLSWPAVLTSWWAIPLVLAPSLLLLSGLALALAAIGTYLRDLANLMPAVVGLLMFLMPVFYPASLVPEGLGWLVQANPIAFGMEALRALLLQAQLPSWEPLVVHALGGGAVLAAGAWIFRRLQAGFVDML